MSELFPSLIPTLEYYALRNQDGNWWANGGRWMMLKKAKIWKSTAGPRSVLGRMAKAHPNLPLPNLVKFTLTATEVFDETARVAKAREAEKRRREKADVRAKEQALRDSQNALNRAKQELANAQRRYEAQMQMQGLQNAQHS